MRWTVPNILTVMRLAAAPGVALMFLYFTRPWADWFALVLFVLAAITDFLDGYLARAWKQESRFGAMLDPIADKAMVVIALLVIVGLSAAERQVMDPWILLPATVILFREVFVSGLREYLGAAAGELKVTTLAKYKTTVQMVAIAVLFAKGVFEHWYLNMVQGMDEATYYGVLSGDIEDVNGLVEVAQMMNGTWTVGVVLLWIAALLTAVTGWDYFAKARPYLRDPGA
ncbi:MAG: CDP-diacylglycerol--glycerol-3-phosphate 3-phosphatidyltransferase [Pseudomonadota bacterium]